MTAKEDRIKTLLHGECEDITEHTVSAQWYRMNVDMDYKGEQPVEIIECEYAYDLYAMPSYMTLQDYNNKTPEQIATEWER